MTISLPEVFTYKGWTIRYRLTTPSPSRSASNTSNTSTPRTQPLRRAVFVHGTPWSSDVYEPIIDALTARATHDILVYDLPGYGQSQHLDAAAGRASAKRGFDGDTSVRFQADALAALLRHTRWDGADEQAAPAVVAHDIAGTIVLRAHLLHGIEFASMMLLNTNTVLPWGDGFYKQARAEPDAFVKMMPRVFEAVVRAVIQSACYNAGVLKGGWEDALARPWLAEDGGTGEEQQQRQRSFVRQIAQADDGDVAEMLEGNMYKQVRCDVKILWGEQDEWIPRHKIEELERLLDGKVKERVDVPNAGHLVMLDQPARVAIEVFDWLNRRPSS